MKKHSKVEIKWMDSGGTDHIWDFKDEYLYDRHELQTVGYWLGYHDGYAWVCQSINPDQYGRKFRIPTGCIKSIKEFK